MKRTTPRWILAALLLLLPGTPAWAQAAAGQEGGGAQEPNKRPSGAAAEEGLSDYARLKELLRRFDVARARRNERELDAVDQGLRRYLQREMAEMRQAMGLADASAGEGPSAPKADPAAGPEEAGVQALGEEKTRIARDLFPLFRKYDPASLIKKRELALRLLQLESAAQPPPPAEPKPDPPASPQEQSDS